MGVVLSEDFVNELIGLEREVSNFVEFEGNLYRYEKLSFDGEAFVEMITDGVRKVVALGKYKNHRTRVDTATLDRYNAGEANLAPEHLELCEVENLRLRIDTYIGNLFKELGEG